MSLSVQAISVTPSPGNQMANHLGGGSLINKGAKNLVVTELYNLVACEVFRLRCIFLNNFFFCNGNQEAISEWHFAHLFTL